MFTVIYNNRTNDIRVCEFADIRRACTTVQALNRTQAEHCDLIIVHASANPITHTGTPAEWLDWLEARQFYLEMKDHWSADDFANNAQLVRSVQIVRSLMGAA
jgi:hypothetical protein